MTDFDVQQVARDAAIETWDTDEPSEGQVDTMVLGIAVIVPAVTQQIRTLHQPVTTRIYEDRVCADGMCQGHHDLLSGACYCPSHLLTICRECSLGVTNNEDLITHPCPTVRLLDQLDAAARGDDRG